MMRFLLSNIRTDWWETIMWRFMTVMSFILLVLTGIGVYFGIIQLPGAIILGLVCSVWIWMGKRNWKFHRKRDGTLLVPLDRSGP
jgi:hypothetical protein